MVLELCQVNDIRIGSLPKDNRIVQELQSRVQSKGTNAALEDVLLTICCGTDMVNIECKCFFKSFKSLNQFFNFTLEPKIRFYLL